MNRLKEVMSTPPILVSTNLGGKFVLETDASNVELGAVLYQRNNNTKCVI